MSVIDHMERTKLVTVRYFELDGPSLSLRPAPEKWSVREILHHLCDAELVLAERICRVISEFRPSIQAFDEKAWAARLGYDDRPMALSAAIYGAARDAIIYQATRHYDASESIEFIHSEMGVRTLRQEFDKVWEHNENHLEQIRKILGG